jgi:hypothetical protein
MNVWELSKALNIGGRDFPIRYDFRAVLDILNAYADPELDESEKTEVMLTIMFPNFKDIPVSHYSEAIARACEFIDCGQKPECKNSPRLIDWEQDAKLIIPAINNAAKCEVRALPELHWWTFFGYYMSIGESLLSTVIRIRKKKAGGKKLDKWEEEFLRDNRSIVDLKPKETAEERAVKDNILSWL